MEIVQNSTELVRYFNQAMRAAPDQTILIDRYLEGIEVEVDAVCDGENVLIPGILEHIERAGVHSGDSMAVYPALALTPDEVETVVEYTRRIGRALEVRGLMNIQYVITGGGSYRTLSCKRGDAAKPKLKNGHVPDRSEVYALEVNPRSSRTIPFISKVTRIPMVRIAIGVMRGRSIEDQGYTPGLVPTRNLVAVKAPVFSMAKLTGVDTFLGPEMKSTGEVMGIDTEYAPAVAKAFVAAGLTIPERGAVLLSIADRDKEDAVDLVKGLADRGHPLMATAGTAALIRKLGIPVREVEKKLSGRRPNALDVIEDQTATAVINTVTGDRSTLQDGFDIRRAAAERRIPCFTSIDTARAAVEAMTPHGDRYSVKRLAEYLDGG